MSSIAGMPAASARVEYVDLHPAGDTFLDDVLQGLSSEPKTLPCKYFYDAAGSDLFEQITRLPEYYPTRTEIGLMRRFVSEMVSTFGPEVRLVEPGSGASVKTQILIGAALDAGVRLSYVPIDISRDFLFATARSLAHRFPRLSVRAVCADYTQGIAWLGSLDRDVRTVYYFPGSTIGNFTMDEARSFLASVRATLRPGDAFLLGTDMKKDPAVLRAAYNDSSGITARFNRHILERIRDELAATVPVQEYDHEAVYNESEGRIEMYLRSRSSHTLSVGGRAFSVRRGEAILTEYSHKFDPDQVRALAQTAGFALEETWSDDAGYFAVHRLVVR